MPLYESGLVWDPVPYLDDDLKMCGENIENTAPGSTEEHWGCDLRTKMNEKLTGFGIKELKRFFI